MDDVDARVVGKILVERERVAKLREEGLLEELRRARTWRSPTDQELDAFNAEHEHLFNADHVWAYERALEAWLLALQPQ